MKWTKDNLYYDWGFSFKGRLLYSRQSIFQNIQIWQTEKFGKILTLDGIIQFTEYDQHIYHEMITHPAINVVSKPKRVLIVGGGDLGSAREVLTYREIVDVVVCDLDVTVTSVCRKFLPKHVAPNSNRLTMVYEDAFDALPRLGKFDVIIADTPDPIGEARRLFTAPFYQMMSKALNPGGAIITQSEHPILDADMVEYIRIMSKELFSSVDYFVVPIPTYPGGMIGFTLMTHSKERIQFQLSNYIPPTTKFYSPTMVCHSIAYANTIRESLYGY